MIQHGKMEGREDVQMPTMSMKMDESFLTGTLTISPGLCMSPAGKVVSRAALRKV